MLLLHRMLLKDRSSKKVVGSLLCVCILEIGQLLLGSPSLSPKRTMRLPPRGTHWAGHGHSRTTLPKRARVTLHSFFLPSRRGGIQAIIVNTSCNHREAERQGGARADRRSDTIICTIICQHPSRHSSSTRQPPPERLVAAAAPGRCARSASWSSSAPPA